MNFFRSKKNLLKKIETLELEVNNLLKELNRYKLMSIADWERQEKIHAINRETEIGLIKKENDLRAREIAVLTLETVNKNTAGRSV